jgi:hypothetical protein
MVSLTKDKTYTFGQNIPMGMNTHILVESVKWVNKCRHYGFLPVRRMDLEFGSSRFRVGNPAGSKRPSSLESAVLGGNTGIALAGG